MKRISAILVLVAAIPPRFGFAETPKGYASFGLGGDIAADGYTGRDPRFEIQLEAGYDYVGFPVSVSFGEDVILVGVKPRIQCWVTPSKQEPKLSIAPGLGPVFNYWHGDNGFATADAYEIGMQISAQVHYQITDQFFVNFTPVELDFNFWRHYSANLGGLSGSRSSTDLGIVYTLLVSGGVNF